jgi:hypothetical protein
MEAGPASAGGIGSAQASDGAGKQNSGKNRPHVSSLLRRLAAPEQSFLLNALSLARQG